MWLSIYVFRFLASLLFAFRWLLYYLFYWRLDMVFFFFLFQPFRANLFIIPSRCRLYNNYQAVNVETH